MNKLSATIVSLSMTCQLNKRYFTLALLLLLVAGAIFTGFHAFHITPSLSHSPSIYLAGDPIDGGGINPF